MTKNSGSNNEKSVILFVEDDSTVCKICEEYLTANGFEVLIAYCAEEALEILSETRVDLVVTNIHMPGMNGLDFTGLIKVLYDIDVIVQTGYRESFSREDAISAGAADFFYKPVKLKDLLCIISRILNK